MSAALDPLLIGLERQSKPIVGNAHIAVGAARYRFRHHSLHLLRHHPDIGGTAAVVDEAIIAETVVQPSEQHDIVLEPHVRPTAAAATSATATPPAKAASTPAAAKAAAAPAAARTTRWASGRTISALPATGPPWTAYSTRRADATRTTGAANPTRPADAAR